MSPPRTTLIAGLFCLTGWGAVSVPQIQGDGHESSRAGRAVVTGGIVTAVSAHGFYLQDEPGDGDAATADALFVFTDARPEVSTGDLLEVGGTVQEFVPGGPRTGNLSITEITQPRLRLLEQGVELPKEILIGEGGRRPPVSSVEAAADFFESLEGMRVRVVEPTAVSPLNAYGEIYVRPGRRRPADSLNARGGLTVAEGDVNPERIQLQLDREWLPGFRPQVDTGASLGDVTGVVSYAFGNYEIRLTTPFSYEPGPLERERTALVRSAEDLTVASFNVRNLGPDEAARHARLAEQIALHLRSPDILALQEIQDDDGSVDSGRTGSARVIAQLIDALSAAGAPNYRYVDIAPQDGQDGGEPGGNIRAGFLYDPARVTLVAGSLRRIGQDDASAAFANSRKPLLAEFRFNDRRLVLVNVHLASKRGSTPLFGRVQPPVDGKAIQRSAQAAVIAAEVREIVQSDPRAGIVVLGDFNDFDFSHPLRLLAPAGGSLTNLVTSLAERERYTYVFEGNSQALDHVLVSASLAASADIDIVHVNAEFAVQASDHDPVLVRLRAGSRSAGR